MEQMHITFEGNSHQRIIECDATLVIAALSFEPKSKWRFIYNGFPIAATIKDESLMATINKGERFGKGDSLKARLRIVQKYDNTCRTYCNSSYKVVEFYSHIHAPQQPTISFSES